MEWDGQPITAILHNGNKSLMIILRKPLASFPIWQPPSACGSSESIFQCGSFFRHPCHRYCPLASANEGRGTARDPACKSGSRERAEQLLTHGQGGTGETLLGLGLALQGKRYFFASVGQSSEGLPPLQTGPLGEGGHGPHSQAPFGRIFSGPQTNGDQGQSHPCILPPLSPRPSVYQQKVAYPQPVTGTL